ncbi:hypothetical protein SAMN04490248_1752 [Salinihabitans flavidus]|uniref:Glycosyl transferase family 2 n=1 Tax=Salinihabitans flavidus TaxID=569882 RepID=A0A1H8WKB8_9RHOB|nr:glycosyltransferase family A protein [Salinihabitans flavidus]SEP28130.1 hypothetical protein SAMN04490248_1752 [Salinihabitans flavidus]
MSGYVISLSTIPPRFGELGPTLKSLLSQTVPAERVILNIPRKYSRFPDWDGRLPEVPHGVEIRRTETDYGPATKLLPTLEEYRGTKIEILFCDDDQIYAPFMAERFLKARAARPEACVAVSGLHHERGDESDEAETLQPRHIRKWRVTDLPFQIRMFGREIRYRIKGTPVTESYRYSSLRAGYADAFQAYCGVMLREDFILDDVFEIPEVCWMVDDIWLSGQAVANGHPVWIVSDVPSPEPAVTHHAPHALFRSEVEGAGREDLNRAAIAHFRQTHGIWM